MFLFSLTETTVAWGQVSKIRFLALFYGVLTLGERSYKLINDQAIKF